MPVRDRLYENFLQFIFGGLIALAVVYQLGVHVVKWCEAISHYFTTKWT